MDIKPRSSIHFVGIGGIGMSALALLASARGYLVSGCNCEPIDERVAGLLRRAGILPCVGHDPAHVEGADLVIHTSAVAEGHPELAAARRLGITSLRRGKLLADFMHAAENAIAVAGAHGKTTVSAMIAWLLTYAGLDPTALVGGIANNLLGANVRVGRENLFVAEADESDRSFLMCNPSVAVVTNVDVDHLTTYRDLEDIRQAFRAFMATSLRVDGCVVACSDCPNVRALLAGLGGRVLTYGLGSMAEYRALNSERNGEATAFDVCASGSKLGRLSIPCAGNHNVQNALAATVVALGQGVSFEAICEAFQGYAGVRRRFEFKGAWRGAMVFDDYGHHPAEMACALANAREQAAGGRVFVVFQPHRYTRTASLWSEFVSFLAGAEVEKLYVADIYSAGEAVQQGIASRGLVDTIVGAGAKNGCEYVSSFSGIVGKLRRLVAPGDVILTLGAGDINEVGEQMLKVA